MAIWKDCVKEPSESGKKVLCQHSGDFYVAQRLGKHYFPIPFNEHPNAEYLCFPETWCEIDFPEPYTGLIRIAVEDEETKNEYLISISEAEVDYPEFYKKFYSTILSTLGSLK